MTNVTAVWLALAIIGFLLLDQFYLGWDVLLVFGRQLLRLIDLMKVWQ